MGQPHLLSPSYDELIEEKHLVRVVNDAIERINLSPLLAQYKGGGTSSYHPKMLLKVLVYGAAWTFVPDSPTLPHTLDFIGNKRTLHRISRIDRKFLEKFAKIRCKTEGPLISNNVYSTDEPTTSSLASLPASASPAGGCASAGTS